MSFRNLGPAFVASDEQLNLPVYTNGRALDATELTGEQESLLTRLAALGKATGYGIIEGLMVEQAGQDLVVSAGRGLNRNGAFIYLPHNLPLSLNPAGGEADPAAFGDCPSGTVPAAGPLAVGAYLLTVTPLTQVEYRSGQGNGVMPGSGRPQKWRVEGLQFKAIPLSLFDPHACNPDATANNDLLRNSLAYWCFGNLAGSPASLNPPAYSEEELTPEKVPDLQPDDLPLAVFYWDGKALSFVDSWSARRRVVPPSGVSSGLWIGRGGEAARAQGQARFLQFQIQLEEIAINKAVDPQKVSASGYFRFLPPAGFLPVKLVTSGGAPQNVPNTVPVAAGANAGAGSDLVETQIQEILARMSKLQDELAQLKQNGVAVAPHPQQDPQAAQTPASGFDLATFFSFSPPTAITILEREEILERLEHSWLEGPVDLMETPARGFDFFVVSEQAASTGNEPVYVMFARQKNGSNKTISLTQGQAR